MFNLKRKPTEPAKVEIINFPAERRHTPFDFLGYSFMPTQVLCVSGVVSDTTPGVGGVPAERHTFRVFMGNQFSIAFHEVDKELTIKKRDMFMNAWSAAL